MDQGPERLQHAKEQLSQSIPGNPSEYHAPKSYCGSGGAVADFGKDRSRSYRPISRHASASGFRKNRGQPMSESSRTPLISLIFPDVCHNLRAGGDLGTPSCLVLSLARFKALSDQRERTTKFRAAARTSFGAHPHQEENSEHFTTHSCTVRRRYRAGNELTSTQSFRASDLLMTSFAVQEAYHVIILCV